MTCPDRETQRLVLRQWTEADEPQMLQIYGDPAITTWLGGMKPLANLAAVRKFRDNLVVRVARYAPEYGGWAVVRKDTGLAIGGALLKPLPDANDQPTDAIEAGWHLAQSAWGQGFATEAAREVLRYGLHDLGLHEIHAVVMPGNAPSHAVAERIGMAPRGMTDAWYGQDLHWWSIQRPA